MPVLLHISDIHRTPDEPVSPDEVAHWLCADIDRYAGEGLPTPDLVVVTGDLTQAATVDEFEEASSLLTRLLDHLGLDVDRLVLIPGNHDISWPACDETIRVFNPSTATPFQKDVAFSPSAIMKMTFEDEGAFQKRLQNFRDFYNSLFGESYPEVRERQFFIRGVEGLNLEFVGLNSCDLLHRYSPRAGINRSAIAEVGRLLSERERPDWRVALWHHDLDWRHSGSADCLNAEDLRLISSLPLDLGLCGHTHRPAKHDASLLSGYRLPVIAAGSLCAGPRQRDESTPRSYNLIELNASGARVWVRQKPEAGTPWRDLPAFGEPGARRSWFWALKRDQAELGSTTGQRAEQSDRPVPLGGVAVRLPGPFAEFNAKDMRTRDVAQEYVWTDVANQIETAAPQIVLGARGCGKTALLMTQSFNARVESGNWNLNPTEALRTIGIFCPMKVDEVTAFNGKGAVPIERRRTVFRAMVASLYAVRTLHTIESVLSWGARHNLHMPSEGEVCHLISTLWGVGGEGQGFASVRLSLRAYKNRVKAVLGLPTSAHQDEAISELASLPLFHGGSGPLEDLAQELKTWPVFKESLWALLFDEVEFLNSWQQCVLYELLTTKTEHVTSKIATLPYAHDRALASFSSVLVEGEDYQEFALSLTGDGPDARGADSEFERLAKGLWESRVRLRGGPVAALDEVWPETPYEIVLQESGVEPVLGPDEMDAALIEDLRPERRQSARALLDQDPSSFSDQIRRKYREIFRFRYARELEQQSDTVSVPLYWGWRQMLKSCGHNPRSFLKLADECWRMFWREDGVRPLTAAEQYAALRSWAESFVRRCASLPQRGAALEELVERVARRLETKLYRSPHLHNEALTADVVDCTQAQAEAIAIGVAYGFLVPRLRFRNAGQYGEYPKQNILLRLGYPVAVSRTLPLRQGEVLKIDSMRQLEFPWWKD